MFFHLNLFPDPAEMDLYNYKDYITSIYFHRTHTIYISSKHFILHKSLIYLLLDPSKSQVMDESSIMQRKSEKGIRYDDMYIYVYICFFLGKGSCKVPP